MTGISWNNVTPQMRAKRYDCGHCDQRVSSSQGFFSNQPTGFHIYLCTDCGQPTYFGLEGQQVPGPKPGDAVAYLPDHVAKLYDEARECVSVGAHTASVLTSRKLLMHIAVEKGAPPNARFVDYVDYLVANNWAPPGSKDWVDHIRSKGNEANHEITLMSRLDAEELLTFLAALLTFMYEFPNRMKAKAPGTP